MKKTKLATLILAFALALALVSPTLLNSFVPGTKGWHFDFYYPTSPIELATLLGYAATIVLIALGTGKLGMGPAGKISAFLGGTIAGTGLLAVTFLGMNFFLNLGGQSATKSFAEEWRVWMTYDMQGFIIAHVVMAIAASTLGLIFGVKMFSADPPPLAIGEGLAGETSTTQRRHFWQFWLRRSAIG